MIFEKLVGHRALRVHHFGRVAVGHRALRVHHFGRVALVRGKNFAWRVSALVLAPGFLIFPLLPA